MLLCVIQRKKFTVNKFLCQKPINQNLQQKLKYRDKVHSIISVHQSLHYEQCICQGKTLDQTCPESCIENGQENPLAAHAMEYHSMKGSAIIFKDQHFDLILSNKHENVV